MAYSQKVFWLLISLPTKCAKSLPLKTENFNFPPITVNNLFKFSAQGTLFVGNRTKVEIPSEIKPSLATARQISENTKNMYNLPNRQIKMWSSLGYNVLNHSVHQKGVPWMSSPDRNAGLQISCSVLSLSKEFLAWCRISVFFALLWGQNISHENLVKCFTCHFRNVFHCVFNTPTESRIIILNQNHGLTKKNQVWINFCLLNWLLAR